MVEADLIDFFTFFWFVKRVLKGPLDRGRLIVLFVRCVEKVLYREKNVLMTRVTRSKELNLLLREDI